MIEYLPIMCKSWVQVPTLRGKKIYKAPLQYFQEKGYDIQNYPNLYVNNSERATMHRTRVLMKSSSKEKVNTMALVHRRVLIN